MLLLAAVAEELSGLTGEIVGVGPVVAAAQAAVLIERRTPSAVLLIGSAGAYPAGPPIGSVVVADRVGFASGVAAMDWGYVPRPPPSLICSESLRQRIALPQCSVLTVAAISTDDRVVHRLGQDWQVEHMETYGVAWACHQAQVPFAAVLGIANEVGPQAHAQWLANREVAHQAVLEAVRPLLSAS